MLAAQPHPPQTLPQELTGPPRVVLFDGVCNMCNAIVRFVMRHDRRKRFRFAALQSAPGQRLLREHGLSTTDLDTFVLIEHGRAFVRSTAGLRVLRGLGLPWSLIYVLVIVPRPLRDWVYRCIASNRYRWFGKREACMMPSEDVRARFLQ